MKSSDFRKIAREKLEGKMGKAACIMLVFIAYSILTSLIGEKIAIINLALLVINIPIGFGLVITYVKQYNGESVGAFEFFEKGFKNFGKAWGISWWIFVKLLVPAIIIFIGWVIGAYAAFKTFVIGFIYIFKKVTIPSELYIYFAISIVLILIGTIWAYIKSYYYKMASIIISENPNMTGKEAVNKSRELMQGKRWKLFCLELSFFWWYLLAVLTLGIGIIWLAPYVQFAEISFYKNLIGENTETEVV